MKYDIDVKVVFKNLDFHFIDGTLTVQRYIHDENGDKKRIDGTCLSKVETQLLRNFLNSTDQSVIAAERWMK